MTFITGLNIQLYFSLRFAPLRLCGKNLNRRAAEPLRDLLFILPYKQNNNGPQAQVRTSVHQRSTMIR